MIWINHCNQQYHHLLICLVPKATPLTEELEFTFHLFTCLKCVALHTGISRKNTLFTFESLGPTSLVKAKPLIEGEDSRLRAVNVMNKGSCFLLIHFIDSSFGGIIKRKIFPIF